MNSQYWFLTKEQKLIKPVARLSKKQKNKIQKTLSGMKGTSLQNLQKLKGS